MYRGNTWTLVYVLAGVALSILFKKNSFHVAHELFM